MEELSPSQQTDHIKYMIEKCMQSFMTLDQIVKKLEDEDNIEHWKTIGVWKRMQEQNSEFFSAYNTILEIIEQINEFNKLLERQAELVKCLTRSKVPCASTQNEVQPMSTELAIHNQFLHQPLMHNIGQPYPNSMSFGISSYDAAYEAPAQNGVHPMDNDVSLSILNMTTSPTLMVSGDLFPSNPDFGTSSITTTISNEANGTECQPRIEDESDSQRDDNGRLEELTRKFSLSDLTGWL